MQQETHLSEARPCTEPVGNHDRSARIPAPLPSAKAVRKRMALGWDPEDAATRPPRKYERRKGPRKKTINLSRVSLRERRLSRKRLRRLLKRAPWRPQSRAECCDVPRPCPYVGCRYNLYLDVGRNGSLTLNFPDRSPLDMPADASCSLDIAERGEAGPSVVARHLNLTRARVDQIVDKISERAHRLPVLQEYKR